MSAKPVDTKIFKSRAGNSRILHCGHPADTFEAQIKLWRLALTKKRNHIMKIASNCRSSFIALLIITGALQGIPQPVGAKEIALNCKIFYISKGAPLRDTFSDTEAISIDSDQKTIKYDNRLPTNLYPLIIDSRRTTFALVSDFSTRTPPAFIYPGGPLSWVSTGITIYDIDMLLLTVDVKTLTIMNTGKQHQLQVTENLGEGRCTDITTSRSPVAPK